MTSDYKIKLSATKNLSPNTTAPPNGTRLLTQFNGVVEGFDEQFKAIGQVTSIGPLVAEVNAVENKIVPNSAITSLSSDVTILEAPVDTSPIDPSFALIVPPNNDYNFRDEYGNIIVEPLLNRYGRVTKPGDPQIYNGFDPPVFLPAEGVLELYVGDGLKLTASPIFDFGGGDFTIEWRVRPSVLWTSSTDIQIAGSMNGWKLRHSDVLTFSDQVFNVETVVDQPYYFSLTRSGNQLLLHVNGTFVQGNDVTGKMFTMSGPLYIGRFVDDIPLSPQPCNMIGFKTTKGQALFSQTSYIVPTEKVYYGS